MTAAVLVPAPLTRGLLSRSGTAWYAAMHCDALGMRTALAGLTVQEREDVALAADMLRSLALANDLPRTAEVANAEAASTLSDQTGGGS